MNIKRILTGFAACAALFLSACSDDDDSAPKKQFAFENESVTLKDANLYLEYEYAGPEYTYRDYVVTDGTYENGNYVGWTYYLNIELGVPAGEEFEAGKFPLFDSFNDAENSNMSYIYYENNTDDEDSYFEYFVQDDVVNGTPVTVSGGFEDGETMTLKFKGELTYYHKVGENWTEEDEEGKLYFKGKIEDVRSQDVNAKAKRGHRAE